MDTGWLLVKGLFVSAELLALKELFLIVCSEGKVAIDTRIDFTR